MNRAVYEAVKERADGRCEFCSVPFAEEGPLRPELDHAFGRGRAPETVKNCWMIHGDCHALRTANKPTAAFWWRAIAAHCVKHSYVEAEQRALKRLEWIHSKAAVAK